MLSCCSCVFFQGVGVLVFKTWGLGCTFKVVLFSEHACKNTVLLGNESTRNNCLILPHWELRLSGVVAMPCNLIQTARLQDALYWVGPRRQKVQNSSALERAKNEFQMSRPP